MTMVAAKHRDSNVRICLDVATKPYAAGLHCGGWHWGYTRGNSTGLGSIWDVIQCAADGVSGLYQLCICVGSADLARRLRRHLHPFSSRKHIFMRPNMRGRGPRTVKLLFFRQFTDSWCRVRLPPRSFGRRWSFPLSTRAHAAPCVGTACK